MKRQNRCILLAFIIWANLKTTFSLPVPEDELDTSTRLLGSSVVTSVSVVTGSEEDGKSSPQSRKIIPGHELPGSPAGLLRPDRFQFYTLNKKGEVVTKQMTEQEIQSLIAAGGGHFATEIHETQMGEDVPTAGMKVADVVKNVQNVLKGELNKPTTVMSSVPTIPGHANEEWSSILPAILSGETENQSINMPETEMKHKIQNPEIEVKPVDSNSLNIKLQTTTVIPEAKPLSETSSASKLKPDAPSTVKKPEIIVEASESTEDKLSATKEKPSTTVVSQNNVKKPVAINKIPQNSAPISEKPETKPTEASSEKPATLTFQKPLKPAEVSRPSEQEQKPHFTVRPDPGIYEEKPLVSIGPHKQNEPVPTSKPSTSSYILLPEKEIQSPTRPTLTKKPTTSETSSKPFYSFRPEYSSASYSEIPMIPVQVITADEILTSTSLDEKDNHPIFQVLNTISADTLSPLNSNTSSGLVDSANEDKQESDKYPVYIPNKTKVTVPEKLNTSSGLIKNPLPEVLFTETSLYTKLPELLTSSSSKTEAPDTLSVVSETHSTSIKIPGYPEISIPIGISERPLTTPKPETMQSTVEKRPEVPSDNDKFLLGDIPSSSEIPSVKETIVPITFASSKETATEKISQTDETTYTIRESSTEEGNTAFTDQSSGITTQATDVPESSTVTIVKKPEATTDFGSDTSTVSALQEIEFQKMPDMVVNEQTFSPETSAIEKIIESLHHSTESKFSTPDIIETSTDAVSSTAESEFSTTFSILDEQTSTPITSHTPSKLTTAVETETTEKIALSTESRIRTSTPPTFSNQENDLGETSKPYEPLTTDLADSVSSMISQISETAPSILSGSQSSLMPEEQLKGEERYKLTTSEMKIPTIETFSTYQQNTELSKVTQSLPNFETTMYKNVDMDTGEIVALENVTETLKDGEISSTPKPEIETSTISMSGIKNDTINDDLNSTPATLMTSSTLTSTTILFAAVETTEGSKSSTESVVDQSTKFDESGLHQLVKNDEPQKEISGNVTENSIIRVTVTESGNTKSPQTYKDKENTESPVIRIQMADAVSSIHQLLDSAPAQTTASFIDLSLLESQTTSPNNIGSGLIAGFPTGNEILFNSQKPPMLNDISVYSNTSSENNTSLNRPQSDENKSKITEDKIKDIDEEIKNSENKINETKEEIKSTEIQTYVIDEVSNITQLNVENSTLPEKETFTTENDSLVSTTIADGIELTTKDIQKTQTELINLELGSLNKELKNDTTDSITSSSELDVSIQERPHYTPELPTKLKNDTISSPEKNQNKTSNIPVSEEKPTTEILNTQNENITAIDNVTDAPTHINIPLVTLASELNETETSASEAMEVIIKTTPKSNTETVITTIKPDITSSEPSKLLLQASTNKTRKPEAPVVRIDLSPETIQPELPSKIQLTDLPIIDKITITNSNSPVAVNSHVSLNDDKLSSDDKRPVVADSNTPKKPELDQNVASNIDKDKKTELYETNATILDQDLKNTSTVDGKEVRIRVNDTAVLVSKLPSVVQNNGTKASDGVEKEFDASKKVSSVSSVPVKEDLVTQNEDKLELLPLKNSSYDSLKEEQNKPYISTILDQKDKPSVNYPEVVTLNTSQSVAPNSSAHDNVSNGSKPSLSKPEGKVPSTIQKEIIDQNKENAYNKLGEVSGLTTTLKESTKNNHFNPFQKKNGTSTSQTITYTKPGFLQGSIGHTTTKPTKATKPSGIGKPSSGPNLVKLPSGSIKNRPGSHETNHHKPTEATDIKRPDGNSNLEEKWALIPQQNTAPTAKVPRPSASIANAANKDSLRPQAQRPQVALDASQNAIGLDGSIMSLDPDIVSFSNLCNQLAFSFWSAANKGLSTSRSLALSPFGMTSMLAMVFLGARGPTSDEMNEVLKLDDVATFNPHLVFQNVTDTVSLARKQGIANAAFVRELFADKAKVGKLMPFYKEQAQQFYEGYVEELNFVAISDIVRRRTNLLIRKQTGGRIRDFVRANSVPLRPPLAALSANVFQTECNSSAASSDGRDGELYFAVSPAIRQRKLIPVPATVWKSGVLAGYEPSLDATVIALGGMEKLVSSIFIVPGQQGHTAPGDNLENLELRLIKGALHDGAWEKLLKVLIPRTSLELQVPKFSHRSIVNATAALKRMGLAELFTKHADLKGINGVGHDLHLSDFLQMNLFSTCGDENISSGRHHVEIYPGPPLRNFRKMSDYDENLDALANGDSDPESEESWSSLSNVEDDPMGQESIGRSSRQGENPEKPRLKLDRPFLYFVRHNPTGLILHMGRFNPRLLP